MTTPEFIKKVEETAKTSNLETIRVCNEVTIKIFEMYWYGTYVATLVISPTSEFLNIDAKIPYTVIGMDSILNAIAKI